MLLFAGIQTNEPHRVQKFQQQRLDKPAPKTHACKGQQSYKKYVWCCNPTVTIAGKNKAWMLLQRCQSRTRLISKANLYDSNGKGFSFRKSLIKGTKSEGSKAYCLFCIHEAKRPKCWSMSSWLWPLLRAAIVHEEKIPAGIQEDSPIQYSLGIFFCVCSQLATRT